MTRDCRLGRELRPQGHRHMLPPALPETGQSVWWCRTNSDILSAPPWTRGSQPGFVTDATHMGVPCSSNSPVWPNSKHFHSERTAAVSTCPATIIHSSGTASEFSFGEPPSSTLRLRPSSNHRDWFRDEDMGQARAGRLKPGSFAERNHWLYECCQTGGTYA